MFSEGVFSLSSILTMLAAATIIWFLFGRRGKEGNTTAESDSSSESESESTINSGKPYDVFLSFRGDTRRGFTDYLYHDLVAALIHTCRDREKIVAGDKLGTKLFEAIEESKIAIIVFSKGYAESKWCLRELTKIAECKKKEKIQIIPIFYDVTPDDIKDYQKGCYKQAFKKHAKEKELEQWKHAFEMFAGFDKLIGHELQKETGGHEGELVKKIVENVVQVLKKNYTHLPDTLVGMDHHIREMERLIDVNYNGVRVVGIHGMGGIGKTTISKVVYNQLCDRFDCCCFLDDVRAKSQRFDGVVSLQSELIAKITKQQFIKIENPGDGIDKIKDVVGNKKILIVLDDIDGISQFDQLVGKCNWFGHKSRIVITTRNKDVLDVIEVTCRIEGFLDVYRSYEPQLMNDDHSLILFSSYAFKQKSPPQDYDILSKDVVSTASGLPLVLVTLGSLLFGKDDQALWEEILGKLKRIPNKDVLEKLRISFKALEHEQQQIFLDVACLFIGVDKTYPAYMWDACGYYPKSGIETLVLRSLVRVEEDNKLRMHDQLRDLGRQIVREENLKEAGECSRVWETEEALDVLKGGLGTKKHEALNLVGHINDPFSFVSQDFYQLQNLRYLRLDHVELDGDFKHLFPKLRWLVWSSWGEFIPINLNLKNLVVLELSVDTLMDEREGWALFKLQEAKKLKVLELVHCNNIKKLSCSTFEDLEILTIMYCNSLLEVTDLSNLKRLKEVTFDYCHSLSEIHGLEKLEVLEVLIVKYCGSMERLPNLSTMRMLKKLHLIRLDDLREIEGLGGIQSLMELSLEGCGKLREVGNLGGLESLELLSVQACKSLERLSGLLKLKKLKYLHLQYCKKLKLIEIEGLGGLVTLEILELVSCNSLAELLDFSELKNLKKLMINWFQKLREIGGLEQLISLESLSISQCDSIRKLPNLSHLTSLTQLVVSDCPILSEIKGVRGLVSLESLDLSGCTSLGNTLDLSCLRNLKKLNACYSDNLTEISGLEELKSLEVLNISGCSSLEKLSDLSNLKSLKTLNTDGCEKLYEVEGLYDLLSLEYLRLSACNSLRKTLDFSCLKYLKELQIYDSKHLTEISGLEELKSLEKLTIRRCSLLKKLSNLSNLTNLRELNAQGCKKLPGIEGLSRLILLEELNLSSCISMGNTLDFSCLKNLKELRTDGMNHLTEIMGLEESKSLRVLDVWRCTVLKKLPDLSNLTNLKKLRAKHCAKLLEIQGLEELKKRYCEILWTNPGKNMPVEDFYESVGWLYN